MGNDQWLTASIDDIKAIRPHSTALGPFGSTIRAENFVPLGVPLIRGFNLNSERFKDEDFVFISDEKANELASANAFPEDLVFTYIGTIGQVGIIPKNASYPRYVISQNLMKLTCDLEKVDPMFVFYYFRSHKGQHSLLLTASSTGVPVIHRPLTSLRTIRIPLPPLCEQQAIVHILGTLDDKIELNRQMNETLEALARAIFKSWFVDFDPVRAKMEGREPYGMDAETAVLFPDSFKDSVLGEIPKGWQVKMLTDVISIHDSKRIPLSSLERAQRSGPYPYYGAASVLDFVDNYLFEGIYILMGEDGSVIDVEDHPVIQYVWGKFWVNNHAHVLQGQKGVSTEHIMLFLRQVNLRPYVTGAVQPKLNQANMTRIPFLLPSIEICKQFEQILTGIYEMYRSNCNQISTLTTVRDTLIPKLLSGEIKLKDAEKVVETHV